MNWTMDLPNLFQYRARAKHAPKAGQASFLESVEVKGHLHNKL